jgi:hypothetical protein
MASAFVLLWKNQVRGRVKSLWKGNGNGKRTMSLDPCSRPRWLRAAGTAGNPKIARDSRRKSHNIYTGAPEAVVPPRASLR